MTLTKSRDNPNLYCNVVAIFIIIFIVVCIVISRAPAYCQIVTRNDRHSGKCIDVAMNDEGEVGSRVIIYEKKDQFHRDGNDNQLWYEDKYGIIHSKIKDMVIDTSGKF